MFVIWGKFAKRLTQPSVEPLNGDRSLSLPPSLHPGPLVVLVFLVPAANGKLRFERLLWPPANSISTLLLLFLMVSLPVHDDMVGSGELV